MVVNIWRRNCSSSGSRIQECMRCVCVWGGGGRGKAYTNTPCLFRVVPKGKARPEESRLRRDLLVSFSFQHLKVSISGICCCCCFSCCYLTLICPYSSLFVKVVKKTALEKGEEGAEESRETKQKVAGGGGGGDERWGPSTRTMIVKYKNI